MTDSSQNSDASTSEDSEASDASAAPPRDDEPSASEDRFTLDQLPTLSPDARRRWRNRLFVAAVAAAVLIPLAGSFGLWDPWETHYGEVARQITERNDWISTWWGSHWQDAAGQTEGDYFYSKPILLMWMMAFGMEIFGFSEWGIRLGVTVVAITGLTVVYAMGASVFRRRTGVLMAGVLGTSPFWFFLSRQAQTDMPFVGLMTVGMCFFLMGMFGKDRNETADWLGYGLTFGFFGLVTLPQIWLVFVGLAEWRGGANVVMHTLTHPPTFGLLVGGVPILAGASVLGYALWRGRTETDEARASRRRWGVAALGVTWVPQLGLLVAALVGRLLAPGNQPVGTAVEGWWVWGPTQAAVYASCFAGVLYLVLAKPVRERRVLSLLTFYVFIALATMAKGLLGFLLPGCVLFFYILLTREWASLKRVQLPSGTLAFVAVGFPWYAAMLIRHTQQFWTRFFVHDHFKRLGSGVHQIDTGSFEHFIRWLGYGLFPWSALIPATLAGFFTGRGLDMEDDRGRATLILLLWSFIAFLLFTLSSTKFHHYVFPAIPPLALLVALTLDDALDREVPQAWPLYLVGVAVFGLVAWDLIHDPQTLKNLFTYKYEREWNGAAWNGPFRFWLMVISIPGALGIVWFLARNRVIRRIAVGLMFVSGLSMAMFGLNYYMPTISSTWSQKGLWDAYYTLCTRTEGPPNADPKKRFCEEPAISYKLNWRGETFYTQNEVIPILDDGDWDHFVDTRLDKEEKPVDPFYGIMQRGRYNGSFKRALPDHLRGDSCRVYTNNIKFVLIRVPCGQETRQRARERGYLEDPTKKTNQ